MPNPSHPELELIEKVTVLCWVERSTLAEAFEAGQHSVANSNYVVTDPAEAFEAQREDFEDDSDLLECFDIALVSQDPITMNFEFPKEDGKDE